MAVVGTPREQRGAREINVADDGTRTYRRHWLVEVSQATDDGAIVLTAPTLPQRYDFYATETVVDQAALCREITARQRSESKFHWDVTATYSTRHRDPADEVESPFDEPPEIEFSFETIQEPVFTVIDPTQPGRVASGVLKNAAHVPFDPPPMRDVSRVVCTIARNEASYNVALAIAYQDSVNSDPFFGAQPRMAKMRSLTGAYAIKNGIPYWRITYVIAFNEATWDLQLANVGTHYLATAGTTTLFPFPNGRTGWLRSNGTASAYPFVFSATDHILTWRVHKEMPFGPLNLPISPNV